jgi:hypothetical protein
MISKDRTFSGSMSTAHDLLGFTLPAWLLDIALGPEVKAVVDEIPQGVGSMGELRCS